MADPAGAFLSFRPVDGETLGDFEALFSSPGAPKHCWCMVWRRSSAEARENTPADRKRQMWARIGAGTPVGLIAYRDSLPFAWVSVAPRDTYRNMGGPPVQPGEIIWSIACFYIPRKARGQGLTYTLVDAAVDHARENGATVVEAYPVPPDAPSYRFMGFVPMFEKCGFREIGAAGVRRRVMRLALT